MIRLVIAFTLIFLMMPAFAASLKSTQDIKIVITFYVKEGDNSPYQGRLEYSQDEFAKLSDDDLEKQKLTQFEDWKANTAKLQADQLKAESEEQPK